METCGTATKQRMCIARVASYLLQAEAYFTNMDYM